MMNKEQLQKIVEEIKAGMSIEELDELEREYNEMYQKLKKEEEEKKKTIKED